MRILLVHNRYRLRGGEDVVYEAEADLLESRGHEVSRLEFSNDALPEHGLANRLRAARDTVWSRAAADRVEQAARAHGAEVVHFHNTFARVSPSAYEGAHRAGAATVQTLHQYRLICPGALCIRNERPCFDCVGKKIPWNGVAHGCYHHSRAETAVVATMLAVNNLRRTWRHVDRFTCLSEPLRQRFITGGLPGRRIVAKPNFVADSGAGAAGGREGYVFLGRLSAEKDVATVLRAWDSASMPQLRVIGDGPLLAQVHGAAATSENIVSLGALPPSEALDHIRRARGLIFSMRWYESVSRTMIEAFASATPVITSSAPGGAEVGQSRSGFLFPPGDPAALAAAVRQLEALPPDEWTTLSRNARAHYEAHYTADANYDKLMEIYAAALARRSRSRP